MSCCLTEANPESITIADFTLNMTGSPHPDPGGVNGLKYGLLYPKEDIASFMLVRGRFAWLGTGWLGCGLQANASSCCSGTSSVGNAP